MYRKYEQRFDSGVKKYVWSKIARELTEKLGSQYNIQQCDTKWKVLKNQYKSVKKHNDQSGNSKKNWKFFDVMNDILFKRPEIQSPATCSSRTGMNVLGEITNAVEGAVIANNPVEPLAEPNNTSTPSTSRYQSSFMRKRKAAENAIERRHREKMTRQDRYLDLLERLTSAVERSTPAANTNNSENNSDSE
ncbi:unnamed protein product [Acanthoscelides obtectus]|uniref:Myb/SANT-like DNA-binding domain-containing protein n=1 Tax=Acanthoscelides obtectus TaxID=200917 RepID=A0A9P0Q9J0_ACAOB|nr:unnamed protein product [Acanthoscelides obtectus]CAK1681095.1 hypothetical protein AOBTE_LOCUS33015 [Acanthoscelides obtectus]